MHTVNMYYSLQNPYSEFGLVMLILIFIYIAEAVLMSTFLIAVSDCLGPSEEQIRQQG